MKIKKYMEKNKLSHREFANMIGTSPSTILHFLTGRTKSLSLPVVQRIVKATNGEISFQDIMDEANQSAKIS
jgi:predicted transcriptional regulator